MIEIGVVKSLSGKLAEITADTGTECKSCVLNGTCGQSTLGEGQTVYVINDIGAKIGDVVEFEYDEKELLKGTFVVYMVPFISTIIGLIIGVILEKLLGIELVRLQNATTVLFSVFFLLISVLIVRKIDRNIKSRSRIRNVLVQGHR
jgi:positive regulator of sigma E activity